MPVDDYWGSEEVDLDVEEAVEVDLNGNPLTNRTGRDIPKSIIDAPGDLIVGVDVDVPARLPIGTPGQALIVADDGVSLEYATPVGEEHEHEEYAEVVHSHDEYATDADLTAHLASAHAGLATDAEVAAAVGSHEGAANPHPGYLTPAEGDAAYAPIHSHPYAPTSHSHVDADIPAGIARDSEVTAAVAGHVTTDHAGLATDAEVASAVSSHVSSDHAGLATDAEVASAVSAHEGAGNPHPGYATDADLAAHEADTTNVHGIPNTANLSLVGHSHVDADLPAGITRDTELTAAISTHEGAANPHPTYHTAAEVAADIATHAAASDPHAGYAKESLWAAKGDLISATAPDTPTKLSISGVTDGWVLTKDSAESVGMKWAAAAGGGGVDIPQQDAPPASPAADDLWIDTDEGSPDLFGYSAASTLAYAEVSTAQTGIGSSATPLNGLSVTVTVPAGRRLRISGGGLITQQTAGSSVAGQIQEDGVEVGRWFRQNPVGINEFIFQTGSTVRTPTAGTHTYRLALATSAGTVDFTGTAANPGFILVEDITGTVWPTGTNVSWGMLPVVPACRAYHDTTQSIAYAATTAMVFNQDRYDSDNMHSTSSNTGRITFNTAGMYLVQFHAQMQTAADYTLVEFFIRLNGGQIIALSTIGTHASPTDGPGASPSGVWRFNVGDYVEACIYQLNAASAARLVNASTGNNRFTSEFSATFLGP